MRIGGKSKMAIVGGLAAVAIGYLAFADDVAEHAGVCVSGYGRATAGTMFDVGAAYVAAAIAGDTKTLACIDEPNGAEATANTAALIRPGATMTSGPVTDQGGNAGSMVYVIDGVRVWVDLGCTQYRPWWSPDALYLCNVHARKAPNVAAP